MDQVGRVGPKIGSHFASAVLHSSREPGRGIDKSVQDVSWHRLQLPKHVECHAHKMLSDENMSE